MPRKVSVVYDWAWVNCRRDSIQIYAIALFPIGLTDIFAFSFLAKSLPLTLHSAEMAVLRNEKRWGNIGQGVIKYGCHDNPPNYLTTLADSIRVADDFGKFRVQYELHEPLIGMHGSFVVCQTAVEAAVGFDHGISGSITEDAYFALVARAEGVKVRRMLGLFSI